MRWGRLFKARTPKSRPIWARKATVLLLPQRGSSFDLELEGGGLCMIERRVPKYPTLLVLGFIVVASGLFILAARRTDDVKNITGHSARRYKEFAGDFASAFA